MRERFDRGRFDVWPKFYAEYPLKFVEFFVKLLNESHKILQKHRQDAKSVAVDRAHCNTSRKKCTINK